MGFAALYPSYELRTRALRKPAGRESGGLNGVILVAATSRQVSKTVAQPGDPVVLSAMVAAIKGAGLFESMPDDARSAPLAGWCKGKNGALKAIESVRFAVHHDLKSLVVRISAGLATGHLSPP
ncbi:hypothetical protein [Bradyrhizobium sp. AUGA SZCCT0160]|uniref:hypothetical protein n=1 Tax=Bradyrhizobium sp. AUGA SZCCT0160 TaxID=2807662 RepID=UPI001BADB533|nr:hypothetical protein [Bradyrhizobium sp. AUGA SZCCT0160]MBR1193956.1 hypothetical protein [Bradyrhizobium sp. AUGA SZCCT0160]